VALFVGVPVNRGPFLIVYVYRGPDIFCTYVNRGLGIFYTYVNCGLDIIFITYPNIFYM
jgi:hypothetical protein